jgi:ABC-type antimicrobial peptide transport system ATPase subunit
VMLPGDEPTGRVMREGETAEVGNTRYTIDKIRLAPPSVDVTKKLIESNASEQQTLTLPAAASPTTP